MNTLVRFWQFVVLAGAATVAPLIIAEEATPEINASFIDPSSDRTRSIRDTGSQAIDRLMVTMISDINTAIASRGLVGALDQCHFKDLPMKDGAIAGMPRIKAVKLTSLKLRNPKNAPDAAEKLALDKIRIGLLIGAPPDLLVQYIELPGGSVEFRVYKPLANIRQCGTCHAKPEEQPPELREALQKRYPSDEASAYGNSEWHGLIRVTVSDAPPAPPPPPAPPAAPKATKPARH